MLIIVGVSRDAAKAFSTQRENRHSDRNLNNNCLENIRSTGFVFCCFFELCLPADTCYRLFHMGVKFGVLCRGRNMGETVQVQGSEEHV